MTKTFWLVLSIEAMLTTALLPDQLLSLLHVLNPSLIPLLFDPHLSLLPLGAELNVVTFHMDS
jgi:hypothetical protein